MIRCGALALLPLVLAACGESPRYGPADSSRGADTADAGAREVEPGSHAVYVPAYSHIYHQQDDAYLLTVTLSIRNTDLYDPMTIRSIRYFDTAGALVRHYLREPRTLRPFESMEVIIEEDDASGGSGANFLVEWSSEGPVSPPVIEAVMISTSWGQGISFTSRGVPIQVPVEAREGE